jgi:hypothetical protein
MNPIEGMEVNDLNIWREREQREREIGREKRLVRYNMHRERNKKHNHI